MRDFLPPRTPSEFYDFVNEVRMELAGEMRENGIGQDSSRLQKKLQEELRPFAIFLKTFFRDIDVVCIPNFGNENFDGEIRYSDTTKASIFVEITCAIDGYDHSMRQEVLRNQGHVSAVGEICSRGTKASGNKAIEVKNQARPKTALIGRENKLIQSAITKKSNRKYGSNHVLLVVYNDSIVFKLDSDVKMLVDCGKKFVNKLHLDFGGIYFVGMCSENVYKIR